MVPVEMERGGLEGSMRAEIKYVRGVGSIGVLTVPEQHFKPSPPSLPLRYGSLLAPSQRQRILEGVQSVSQHVTRLMGSKH